MPTNRLAVSALMIAASAWLGTAAQSKAEDFYQGKQITLAVGYAPGGSYDLYARLLARHMGRHIPGNPNVIVVNVPGAATLNSLHYLDVDAPKDGTVIDSFDWAQIGNARLTPDKVQVDFRKYNWIGSMVRDLAICYVWHTVDAKTIDDLRQHSQIHMGSASIATSADIEQKIFKNVFKLDIVPITGYGGSSEERLAIERGELDGDCGSWTSLPADWISDNKIKPLLKFGEMTAPDMPPNVPLADDIAPSTRDHAIIRMLTAGGALGKPFVANRSVPPDRVAILRAAFDATLKDPMFLADAEKQRLLISPTSGDEAMKIVDEIYAAPADIVAAARTTLGE